VAYEDIGGLRDEVDKVREMIELPLRHPELFERLGVDAPKGGSTDRQGPARHCWPRRSRPRRARTSHP